MPLSATIEQPARETNVVSLYTVRNVISSMMLLIKGHDMPGVSSWVSQTQNKLSADELFRHELVIIGFFHAILPEKEWASFSDYLDDLEQSNPIALRDRMLNTYAKVCYACDETLKNKPVNWDAILGSADSYVSFLKERFGEKLVDVEMETKAYAYVIDPPAMQRLIVDHLRWFWTEHLEQEWSRAEPLLRESVKAFQNVTFDNMSRLEMARYITGQDLNDEKWQHTLDEEEPIIFAPNPHISPYVTRLHDGKTLLIVFGARIPEDSNVRIPELDRADIVARMSALADDTRLRILQMIAEQGELRSQEIMEVIDLSQPSVSRYLTQLTATGYLQERRVNGSKAYVLNRDRIEKTLKAIHKFLLG